MVIFQDQPCAFGSDMIMLLSWKRFLTSQRRRLRVRSNLLQWFYPRLEGDAWAKKKQNSAQDQLKKTDPSILINICRFEKLNLWFVKDNMTVVWNGQEIKISLFCLCVHRFIDLSFGFCIFPSTFLNTSKKIQTPFLLWLWEEPIRPHLSGMIPNVLDNKMPLKHSWLTWRNHLKEEPHTSERYTLC